MGGQTWKVSLGKLQPGTPQSLLLCYIYDAPGSCWFLLVRNKAETGTNRNRVARGGVGGGRPGGSGDNGDLLSHGCISHAACDALHSLIYI